MKRVPRKTGYQHGIRADIDGIVLSREEQIWHGTYSRNTRCRRTTHVQGDNRKLLTSSEQTTMSSFRKRSTVLSLPLSEVLVELRVKGQESSSVISLFRKTVNQLEKSYLRCRWSCILIDSKACHDVWWMKLRRKPFVADSRKTLFGFTRISSQDQLKLWPFQLGLEGGCFSVWSLQIVPWSVQTCPYGIWNTLPKIWRSGQTDLTRLRGFVAPEGLPNPEDQRGWLNEGWVDWSRYFRCNLQF